jgi:hypothetical protein
MILYILNGLNGPVDLVDTFKSVIWNVQFYGFSEFELVVPGTPANIQKFKMDRYLVRDSDMSGGTYRNVMVIESVVLSFTVDDGWILTLSGRGLKSIVARRVIWQQTNLKGRVENGIRKVITDNIVSPSVAARKISNFILEKGGSCLPLMSPIDVQLDCDEKTMVQPDVVILCDEEKLCKWGIFGAPDFVLEVISPSTKKKDYTKKLSKYMAAGVKEYWILDPYQQKLIVYYFESETCPTIYGFQDPVSVGIYDGELEIQFEHIRKWMEEV